MAHEHDDAPATEAGPPPGLRERRAADRVAVEFFVRERDGDRLFVHPALNLSATGIFLESHAYSLRNAMERRFIDLEFELPDSDEQLHARGEVIGVRRVSGQTHGLAVRFVDVDEAAAKRIEAFIEARLEAGDGEGPSAEAAPTSS